MLFGAGVASQGPDLFPAGAPMSLSGSLPGWVWTKSLRQATHGPGTQVPPALRAPMKGKLSMQPLAIMFQDTGRSQHLF